MTNEFEAPSAPVERTIKVGGKSAVYRFTEPCAAELEALFAVTDADGKVDMEKFKGQRFRVIAAIVTRADGSSISVEEAGSMRSAVANALYKTAMEVIGTKEDADASGNA